MLALIAVVTWQARAVSDVQVAASQTQSIEGSFVQAQRLVEERSTVLADFYASAAFDTYARTYALSQEDRSDYVEECTKARHRVFLPPFTDRVEQACDDLLGDGDRTRVSAFLPILTKFLRACRGAPTTVTEPYDAAQWQTLDQVVDQALATDCDQRVPVAV